MTVVNTGPPERSQPDSPHSESDARLVLDDDGEALGLRVVDARHPAESFPRARLDAARGGLRGLAQALGLRIQVEE
jgi:hypothetical protein